MSVAQFGVKFTVEGTSKNNTFGTYRVADIALCARLRWSWCVSSGELTKIILGSVFRITASSRTIISRLNGTSVSR